MPLIRYVIEFLTFGSGEVHALVWDDEVYSRPKVFDTEEKADSFARDMIPRYPEFLAYSVKKVTWVHR